MIKCVNISSLECGDNFGGLVEQAEQKGFSGLEIDFEAIDGCSDERYRELIGTASDRGVGICSVTSRRFNLFSLCGSDEESRKRGRTVFEDMLRWAGGYGRERGEEFRPMVVVGAEEKPEYPSESEASMPKLRVGMPPRHGVGVPSGVRKVGSYEEAFNFLFEAMESLAELAERESVMLALENPASGVLLSPLELRELVDELNSPYAGVYFNPFYAERLGEPVDWLRILGRRVVALRLPLRVAEEKYCDVLSEYERLGCVGSIIYR